MRYSIPSPSERFPLAGRSQVIGPVLARLRSFLLRDFVKRTMRYPRSSVDMGKILDGGALLVRIPKASWGRTPANCSAR